MFAAPPINNLRWQAMEEIQSSVVVYLTSVHKHLHTMASSQVNFRSPMVILEAEIIGFFSLPSRP